jgi:hypothetical protein
METRLKVDQFEKIDFPGGIFCRANHRRFPALRGLAVQAPAAFFVSRRPLGWTFAWLALSGAACLLERLGQEPGVIQPVSRAREGEVDDVLRPETISAAERSNVGDKAGQRVKSR